MDSSKITNATIGLLLKKLKDGKGLTPSEMAILREAGAVNKNDKADLYDLEEFLISGGSVRGRRLTPIEFCEETGIDTNYFETICLKAKVSYIGQIIGREIKPSVSQLALAWTLARDYYSINLAINELNSRLQNPAALDAKAATDAAAQVERLTGKRGPIVAAIDRIFNQKQN